MDFTRKRRLGDLLVEGGKITPIQLQDALKKQKIQGIRLGELLVNEGIVTDEDISEVLEKQLNIKRVNLDNISIDMKAINHVPQSICENYELIPFGFDENKILIAMSDPLNIIAVDDVSISSGFEVKPFIANSQEIKRNIQIFYSSQQVQRAAEELSKDKNTTRIVISEEEFDDIRNTPVVKMIDNLIKNAAEANASDIHIEPYENYIRIRYRIDGQLQEISRLSIDTLPVMVTRIKIMANLNIAEKRIPQDGRILTKIGKKDLDLRVSILPTVCGEKVVIRVLSKDNIMLEKEELGLAADEMSKLNNIISSPHGIILVTGPTGSGKSTTLYTILKDLNTEGKNIITVEDPVEYTLDGVNQVNVNVKAGLTFASGLRSILRQDPDIIMIGEIRDAETAEIATRAAITGHLVLSTLHTNDAPSTVLRLIDMGVEPYLVATSLSGVIAQRLVKKICPKCKVSYKANEYEKKILNVQGDVDLYHGEGCPFCGGSGYKGRIGVYEIMEISKKHKELILYSKNSDELKEAAVSNGMKTLAMSCKEMVLRGQTTMEQLADIAFIKD